MGEGNPLVTPEDWLESCFCPGEKILLHFYCKELSEAEFCKFEKRGLQAPEYGVEVLGLVRCGSTVHCIVLFVQIEYSQTYFSSPFLQSSPVHQTQEPWGTANVSDEQLRWQCKGKFVTCSC